MINSSSLFGLTTILIFFLVPTAFAEETKTIFVGPNLVDCVGVAPQQCMLVREEPNSSWNYFYDSIQGFDFEPGYEYELQVLVTDVKNPPADASSKKYELIQVANKKPKSNHHIPYKGICAPGFVPLGEICVLNDRCGPGAYAGKVCVMDGITQPYLRPLQQKHAGISVDNIICAEDKELIFKSHDVSPACVNPSSIEKLKKLGWQTEKPAIACTLEYNPICGMDGMTYGNPCMLNAQHMAIKHKGECEISTVTNFDECVAAGNPVMESYPRQCRSLDGQLFVEDINIQKTEGVFADTMMYTKNGPTIDEQKGFFVDEIAYGVYWLVGSGYQTMFVTTSQGVVVVDGPQPIGEKYLDAITEVTSEPITHMIYSHHHQDHTGATGQIFPQDITYISHQETANVLAQENDPNRPVPTQTFDGTMETLSIGDQTIELHHLGNFHSNGDILILIPEQKVAMLVDLFRPDEPPYRAFGVTPDIDLYLQTHDVLLNFDFDVLISGHTNLLATKEHIMTNKEFTLDVMENAKKALDMEGDIAENCAQLTTVQWQGKLSNLDTFMIDHCTAMVDYLSK